VLGGEKWIGIEEEQIIEVDFRFYQLAGG